MHIDPEVTGAIVGAGVSAALAYLLGSRQGRVNAEKKRDDEVDRRLRKLEVDTAVLEYRSKRRTRES